MRGSWGLESGVSYSEVNVIVIKICMTLKEALLTIVY